VPHVLEPAASGRAKCRGCGRPIAAGEVRFGERLPNPFAAGEMTLWFHPECAAFKRPEPFLEALQALEGEGPPADGAPAHLLPDAGRLRREAERGLAHRRLPRIDGAERAPSGRAQCRSCKEPIPKGAWRIRLVFFEEGRFEPGGFVHARCAPAYFETADLLGRVRRFAPALTEDDLATLRAELAAS
jgi:hypothetical protein